jgi:hypothetical protein
MMTDCLALVAMKHQRMGGKVLAIHIRSLLDIDFTHYYFEYVYHNFSLIQKVKLLIMRIYMYLKVRHYIKVFTRHIKND